MNSVLHLWDDLCFQRLSFMTERPETWRRISRWLFLHFPVYYYDHDDPIVRCRFITRKPFSDTAFRALVFGLRDDASLNLWILTYDLCTLRMERSIYCDGHWTNLKGI